jgi:hypothetical protein
MYDGNEYLQSILLNYSKIIILLLLNHGMYFVTACHEKFTIRDGNFIFVF